MVKAKRCACHHQGDSGVDCQESEPRPFRIATVSLSGEDVLRPPAGELSALFLIFAMNRQRHADVSRPCANLVFVLGGEIGLKKGRLFPRPPKHHQCSTTSCCIFSDMFAWAQTRVFPFEQGMRALKIVRLPDWVWSGCECPVSFSGRNSDYGAAVISIEGFSCWQPELIDWLIVLICELVAALTFCFRSRSADIYGKY